MSKRKTESRKSRAKNSRKHPKGWFRDPKTHRLLWIPSPSKAILPEQPPAVNE